VADLASNILWIACSTTGRHWQRPLAPPALDRQIDTPGRLTATPLSITSISSHLPVRWHGPHNLHCQFKDFLLDQLPYLSVCLSITCDPWRQLPYVSAVGSKDRALQEGV
jgi:hypothetical protein